MTTWAHFALLHGALFYELLPIPFYQWLRICGQRYEGLPKRLDIRNEAALNRLKIYL